MADGIRYIKAQFLNDSGTASKPYIYKTHLDVQIGEIVMITEKAKGIIIGFVPPALIQKPEEVKEIFGQIPREDGDVP